MNNPFDIADDLLRCIPFKEVTDPALIHALTHKLPDTSWTKLDSSLPDVDYDYAVKSWPWFFQPMIDGAKKHDMRDKRDRDYAVGDKMLLREWDPRNGDYTGRWAVALITYITSNDSPCAMSSTALARDACILSVEIVESGE